MRSRDQYRIVKTGTGDAAGYHIAGKGHSWGSFNSWGEAAAWLDKKDELDAAFDARMEQSRIDIRQKLKEDAEEFQARKAERLAADRQLYTEER